MFEALAKLGEASAVASFDPTSPGRYEASFSVSRELVVDPYWQAQFIRHRKISLKSAARRLGEYLNLAPEMSLPLIDGLAGAHGNFNSEGCGGRIFAGPSILSIATRPASASFASAANERGGPRDSTENSRMDAYIFSSFSSAFGGAAGWAPPAKRPLAFLEHPSAARRPSPAAMQSVPARVSVPAPSFLAMLDAT